MGNLYHAIVAFIHQFMTPLSSLQTVPVYYPNVMSMPLGKNIPDFYSQGGDAKRAVDFYVAFHDYLPITSSFDGVYRWIIKAIAQFLYTVVNSLQFFYVKMFALFQLGDSSYYKGNDLYKWLQWGQELGFVVFVILFLGLMIGTFIFYESSGFKRMKGMLWNLALITFFVSGLPYLTNQFANGVQGFAESALGSTGSKDGHQSISSMSDDIFERNVISLPYKLATMKQGQQFNISKDEGLMFKNEYFFGKSLGNSIPSRSLVINLDKMKDPSSWNGISDIGVNTFLAMYSGNSNVMNRDNMDDYGAVGKAADQMGENNPNESAADKLKHNADYISKHPFGALAGFLGGNFTSKAELENYHGVFKNYVMFTDYSNAKLLQFKQFGMGLSGTIIPPFMQPSYGYYKVQWFPIISGLSLLMFVFIAYIFKLVIVFYKAMIMYATSALVLLASSEDQNKVKLFIRNFWGLYELIIIDIVMLRLFFVAYFMINSATAEIMYSSQFPGLANPFMLGLVRFVANIALFTASIKGVDAINKLLGQPTGNSEGIFNAMATLQVASMLSKPAIGAAKMANSGGRKAIGYAKSKMTSNNHDGSFDDAGIFGNATKRGSNSIDGIIINERNNNHRKNNNEDKKDNNQDDDDIQNNDVNEKSSEKDNVNNEKSD